MKKIGFVAFFMVWAEVRNWKVPPLHLEICMWLESCFADVRILEIFRGAAKSTIYAIYKAWRLYCDPTHRSLVWSEDSRLAKKMNRDVISVLRRHPFCRGMLPQVVGAEEFWVVGFNDARNPSMSAYGVLSNATGSRADAVDFDDIEVPKNIRTADSRQKLRERISEATHIIVPGGQKTYIGTPHTHDSVYDEQSEGGAALLKIPLFAQHIRYEETATRTQYRVSFNPGQDGLYIFVGIHRFARLLVEHRDYEFINNELILSKPPANVLDIYAECAWPERFNRKDLLRRRLDTRTLNAWDSQYSLEAKPVQAIRLDPAKIRPYDVAPEIIHTHGSVRMMLGRVQIVSATARWDCALGRLRGDDSAFSVMLQDDRGHYYWQVARALTGSIFTQCQQIRETVTALQLPRVVVETNGPGAFAPAVLRKELQGTGCGVGEEFTKSNKNARILEAFEAPMSGGFLWAHADVLDMVWDEMKDWKPLVKDQIDNFLDSGAGAITDQPQRIGRIIGTRTELPNIGGWRPNVGTFDVELDLSSE